MNGAILPLGAFPLKAHARHVDGSGITRIEFLVNGAADTDSAAPIVYAEASWNAWSRGEYSLSARAYAGGEATETTPARVCVSQEVKEPLTSPNGGCGRGERPKRHPGGRSFVQDGQSSIREVYLVYGFTGAGAEGIFVQMSPIGGGYYRAVVDIGAQAYNFFQGANGSIGIAVIGNDSAGNSGSANVPDVPLLFCPG